MNITVSHGDIFKKIINCILDLTTCSEMNFNKDGLSIRTMDFTHVCLIDVFFPCSFFENYDINGSLIIGVNFKTFSDILKLGKKNTKISYIMNSDKLLVDVSDSRTVKFEMMLINSLQDPLEFTELEYDYLVYMNTQEFNKIIKEMNVFGDRCTIYVSDDLINFTVSGDSGSGDFGVESFNIDKLNDNAAHLKLIFNLEFLLSFSKTNISNQVLLKFSSVSPFCCEYKFEDTIVSYYLGQMIE